jgi:hypothetical protein
MSCRRVRSFTARIIASLLLAVAAGCGGTQGGAPTTTASAPSPKAKANDTKPFQLKATEDVAHRQSEKLKVSEGGVIATTDAEGTRYRLFVPVNALLMDTEVSITPLTGITGIPGQTRHYGVDIQPSGTRLLEFARLEITPTTPTPKDVYWLETTGPANAPVARPAFMAIKKPGMLLLHFSGGTEVAGGPETSSAMHAGSGNAAAVGSREWLQWQQNVVQQDFDAGRIDSITKGVKDQIIKDRLDELTAAETEAALQQQVQTARQSADIIDIMDAKDVGAVRALMADALGVAHQMAILGLESDIPGRVGPAFFKWYDKFLESCALKGANPVTVIELERQLQQMGYESKPALFSKCAEKSGAAKMALELSPDPNKKRREDQKKRAEQSKNRIARYTTALGGR